VEVDLADTDGVAEALLQNRCPPATSVVRRHALKQRPFDPFAELGVRGW
jgi:hypothetical protein